MLADLDVPPEQQHRILASASSPKARQVAPHRLHSTWRDASQASRRHSRPTAGPHDLQTAWIPHACACIGSLAIEAGCRLQGQLGSLRSGYQKAAARMMQQQPIAPQVDPAPVSLLVLWICNVASCEHTRTCSSMRISMSSMQSIICIHTCNVLVVCEPASHHGHINSTVPEAC